MFFKNLRFYILLFSILLAASIYVWIVTTVQIQTGQAIKLSQFYGLIATVFLYFTLLVTPLTQIFKSFPLRERYIFVRRALGVSAFVFALLHSCFSFFGELGGFDGLGFLDNRYLIAIGLSFIALVLLFLTTAISFDKAIEKLSFPKWKILQRFVYLASFLILVHVLILGSHFSNLSDAIPQIFFALLACLLLLESLRVDRYISSKYLKLPINNIAFCVVLIIISVSFSYIYFGQTSGDTASFLNVHSVHIQLAKQAQLGQGTLSNNPALANNPALIGDRTRRFTVSFNHSNKILPNQDVDLQFQVFDASSGNEVNLYSYVYTKLMHLVIVDDQLNYLNHIHPTENGSKFNITTQFPHEGRYHLYVDFQPLGAIEQQMAFTVDVGSNPQLSHATQAPDVTLTKNFDKYSVKLTPSSTPFKAQEMSIGNQTLSFTINDAKTNQPVTTLKPYLAAYGHLVLINETTFEYIHVHPSNIFPPAPDANGGPRVDFIPLGLYGPIRPGIYRVFGQFNPDNSLFLADFTVKIE